ncbi:MAG: HlyD family efflux transporter periplasmic adaptor subunit [Bacteroidaceae bacterium]|nr:HlyD family efflux transporter periplasmic adaptor subunit [Bacteroidaceae bacterium]
MKRYWAIALGLPVLVACNESDYEYDATGIFEATEVLISAKGQGEIVSLVCEEGDEVASGATLGVIDTTMLSLQKRALLANQSATVTRRLDVSSQVASLRQQKANLGVELERFEQLFQKGAASQKQVADLSHQISVIDKQIAAMTEQVSTANKSIGEQGSALESQVMIIRRQMDDCLIKSPITGTILNKYAEQGEFAAPGKPLLKVADIQNMILRAYITAGQYNQIKIGQKVAVTIDGREQPYEGTVTWINSKAEFTPKTIQTKDERQNLVYAVKVSVRNDGLIKIGMYGDVKL